MRTIITLLLLSVSITANAWEKELYALAGNGRTYKNASSKLSGNFGMATSLDKKHWYFNAGLGLYVLNGDYPPATTFIIGVIGREETNYITELALGGGFRYQKGLITIKAGPDLGVNFNLNVADLYLSVVPKVSVTFRLGAIDLGIVGKYGFPVSAPGTYSPQFLGGGILLRI